MIEMAKREPLQPGDSATPVKTIKERLIKTYLFPKNHSEYNVHIVSWFNREEGKGSTRVIKCYMLSFYLHDELLEELSFVDEQEQVSYHNEMAQKYHEYCGGGRRDQKENKQNN